MDYQAIIGRLNPLAYEPVGNKLLAGSLLALAGILLGAGIADLADDPVGRAAFLDDGWIRSLVNERWWLFGIIALFTYAIREGFPLGSRDLSRPLAWRIPLELVAVFILAVAIALALSWLSVQFFPCTIENRC